MLRGERSRENRNVLSWAKKVLFILCAALVFLMAWNYRIGTKYHCDEVHSVMVVTRWGSLFDMASSQSLIPPPPAPLT